MSVWIFLRSVLQKKSQSPYLRAMIYRNDVQDMSGARGADILQKCKGTTGKVHQECLVKWLEVSHRDQCEICNYTFQRKNKCIIKPKCTCTERDVLIASNVNNIVIIFVLGSFISTGFIFMYLASRGEYFIINISWLSRMQLSVLLRNFVTASIFSYCTLHLLR